LFKILSRNETEGLVIAGILDEFSYDIFKYECNLIYLNPLNYKRILASTKIHLLLVESFWDGMDEKWNDLQTQIGESKISIIRRIVKYCKMRNIPTVFWNKEDPIYFYIFKDMAKIFDFVFTTDVNCIYAYTKLLGHSKVYALPFAAQPVIHNPIDRNADRIGRIAFAGSWQANCSMHRKKDMDIVIKPAFKYDLSIYDRNYHRELEYLRYPKDYEPYIKGGLPYNEIVKMYKKYDIFLNVNSEQNSPTMFSRRIFELLACGTNVISGYSTGIEKLFSGIIPLCRTADETENYINELLNDSYIRDRLSILGQREIFKYHTCKHRLAYILDCIGTRYSLEEPLGVSIITWMNKPEDLERILANFSSQLYNLKEMIIIVRNSMKTVCNISNSVNVRMIFYDENAPKEECVAEAINQTVYKYISFFHPSGYYGANFLGDLMNVFLYAKADIVTKLTHYVYLKGRKELYIAHPDNEYKFCSHVNPYAGMINKSVLKMTQIVCSNEEHLISEMHFENDVKVYSADRFNYVLEDESEANKYYKICQAQDNKMKLVGSYQNFEEIVMV
jgi:spore maturation protein CgeB